jgi:hypothetical protein
MESKESATDATSGGPSGRTISQLQKESTGATESAICAARQPTPTAFMLDGWVCDSANPFGHSICRSVTARGGDWPVSLCLTAGDGSPEPMRVPVPEAVLRWLLIGKQEEPTNGS